MADDAPERESMEFDIVIVGAGPAGLSAAIRLKQRAAEAGNEISVVVVEKGSEVGAHILSGAVLDPSGLDALIPDWRDKGAPATIEVASESFKLLGPSGSVSLPVFAMPPMVKNHGNYIVSMGNICRWLAEQAENLGVDIYPGMAHLSRYGGVKTVIPRRRLGERRRRRRSRDRQGWSANGSLRARHGALRKIRPRWRGRARLARQTADRKIQP